MLGGLHQFEYGQAISPLFIHYSAPLPLNLSLFEQTKNEELLSQHQQRNYWLQNYLENLAVLKQRAETYDFYFKAQNLFVQNANLPNQILTKIEERENSVSSSPLQFKPQTQKQETDPPLQETITSMVNFLVYEFGRTSSSQIFEQRKKYLYNRNLLDLFDILVKKYNSSTKCREDITRFVLRKALGSMRDVIRDRKILSAKAASVELCQKYFKDRLEQLTAENIDIADEDTLLNFLLPYKKQSRNKTANSCFITEIFSSELFYQDYLHFLENIDKLLEDDNQKKIKKFTSFLVGCIQEDRLSKVASYKRLPWLKAWLHSTKIIANELLSAKLRAGNHAKSKGEALKKQKF